MCGIAGVWILIAGPRFAVDLAGPCWFTHGKAGETGAGLCRCKIPHVQRIRRPVELLFLAA